jgi:hypothetical protein
MPLWHNKRELQVYLTVSNTNMNKENQLLIGLELLGWLFTAFVVWCILYPIHQSLHVWMFEKWNVMYIIVLITLVRYLFFLPHTFLAKQQVLKFVIFILLIPVTFFLAQGLNGFMTTIEKQTWDDITGHLPLEQRRTMESYLWNEMLFFAAGSVIAAPVLAFRLLVSIWRTHNENRA